MKRLIVSITLLSIASLLLPFAFAQSITAEAVGQANLRAAPDVNSEQVGEILSGMRYPVIGRSEFYPWVLLGDPTTQEPFWLGV